MPFTLSGEDSALFEVEEVNGSYLVYLKAGASISNTLTPVLDAALGISDQTLSGDSVIASATIAVDVIGNPAATAQTVPPSADPGAGDTMAVITASHGGRAVTYEITSGNESGTFAIDVNGNISAVLDPTLSSYTLGVRVKDAIFPSLFVDVSVVIPINYSPAIDTSNLPDSVGSYINTSEFPGSVDIGTISATSPQGNSVTISMAINDFFGFNSTTNTVFVISDLSGAEGSTQTLTFTAVDDVTGLSTVAADTVDVVAVADDSTVNFSGFNVGSLPVQAVLTPTMWFGQSSIAFESYSFTIQSTNGLSFRDENNNGVFAFSSEDIAAGNIFYLLNTAPYSANVTTNSNVVEQVVSANVTAVSNDPPVVSDQEFKVSRYASVGDIVGQVAATDLNLDPLTFSEVSPELNPEFAVSSSGQITVSSVLNTYNSLEFLHILYVDAFDGYQYSQTSGQVDIIVQDYQVDSTGFIVDSLPTVGQLTSAMWSGLPVAEGPTFSFSVISTNNLSFQNSSGTPITSFTTTEIDAGNVFYVIGSQVGPWSVDVQTNGLTVTQTVTPTVNVISNSAPVINNQSFSVSEKAQSGAVVGQLVATDADTDPLTYSFVNSAPSQFLLSSSGEITVNSSLANVDNDTNIVFDVQVTDGYETDTATITVTITEQDPEITVQNITSVGAITLSNLFAVDAGSTNAQITFNVLSVVNGSFILSGSNVNSFTQADVDAGNVGIIYSGNGGTGGTGGSGGNITFELQAEDLDGYTSDIYSGTIVI